METFEFLVIASGLDHESDDFENRLIEAGCDDATIMVQKGLIMLAFDREAPSFAAALSSAVRNVDAAGAVVKRVEPDDLVSLSEIARRGEMTRSAVSNYFAGTRGEGFPPPVARIGTDMPLWRWSQVAPWLHGRGRLSREQVVRAQLIADVNAHLASGLPIQGWKYAGPAAHDPQQSAVA